jgi:hypothetical protein
MNPVMMVGTRRSRIGLGTARVMRAAATLSLLAPLLLVANSAQAALREYRIHFAPSPSQAAAGYSLHIGQDSGNYTVEVDLGKPPDSGGTVVYAVDLEDTIDLFVALSAYDASGAASPLSNEIRVSAVQAPTSSGSGSDSGSGSGSGSGSDSGSGSGGTSSGGDTGSGDMGSGGSGSTSGGSSSGSGSTGGGDLGSGTVSFVTAESRLGLEAGKDGEIETVLGDGSVSMLTLDSLAAARDVRPVRCDLDGDGDHDLVIGFGKKSGARLAVIHMERGSVVALGTLEAGTPEYREGKKSHTRPACGDVDGDGLAEIVVGFGTSMGGRVQVFDDEETGFAPLTSAGTDVEGFLQVPVPEGAKVTTLPAIGDIDGDGRGELVVGFGSKHADGRVVFLDDARSDFEVHSANRTNEPWIIVRPSAEWKGGRKLTAPAVGDYDGDGVDEIAIGFGRGSRGVVAILDDVRSGLPMDDSQVLRIAAGRERYQKGNGETRVGFGDVDGDGAEELIVGFARKASYELQVFDDISDLARPSMGSSRFVSSDDKKARWFAAPGL